MTTGSIAHVFPIIQFVIIRCMYAQSICCCSVIKSCLSLWDSMDCSTLTSDLHYHLELVQTHVHWVNDAIRISHPLLSPSALAISFPQDPGFQWIDSLHQWSSIGASASASVLPMNIQGWFPLGLTALISLLSKGLLRLFFSTTIWKHQFFGPQPSLWSNSHTPTWLLEKP